MSSAATTTTTTISSRATAKSRAATAGKNNKTRVKKTIQKKKAVPPPMLPVRAGKSPSTPSAATKAAHKTLARQQHPPSQPQPQVQQVAPQANNVPPAPQANNVPPAPQANETHPSPKKSTSKRRRKSSSSSSKRGKKTPKRDRQTVINDRRDKFVKGVSRARETIRDAESNEAGAILKYAQSHVQSSLIDARTVAQETKGPVSDFSHALSTQLRYQSFGTREAIASAEELTQHNFERYNRLVESLVNESSGGENVPELPQAPAQVSVVLADLIMHHSVPKNDDPQFPCGMLIKLIAYPGADKLVRDTETGDVDLERVPRRIEVHVATCEEEPIEDGADVSLSPKYIVTRFQEEIADMDYEFENSATEILNYFFTRNTDNEIRPRYDKSLDTTVHAIICNRIKHQIFLHVQAELRRLDTEFARMPGIENPLVSEQQFLEYISNYNLLLTLPESYDVDVAPASAPPAATAGKTDSNNTSNDRNALRSSRVTTSAGKRPREYAAPEYDDEDDEDENSDQDDNDNEDNDSM